jgi:hypothetical protein
MGTRTVITFKDAHEEFSVYQHYDGYPSNIIPSIAEAIPYAWVLPRFEARDFGAAYIAANKTGAGVIYMTTNADAHGDLDFKYVVSNGHSEGKYSLRVDIHQYDWSTQTWNWYSTRYVTDTSTTKKLAFA